MGNSWNDLTLKGFATSAGMGALGGALGAGFTAAGTALFGESFASSFGYNFMSNIATNMGVNAAFGSKITWGTVAGSAFGAMLDGAMPNFRGFASGKSYSFWDAIENGVGELAINGAKGAFTGGMSGAIGAAIDGGDVSAGFTNGMRTGVIAAGLRTGLNIVVLGTTIRPSGVSTSLSAMEKDLGIKLNSNPYGPVYRTGAIWRRGLSVGLTHMINDGEGDLDDRRTWVHESYHYFQNLKQGWWRQLWNGAYEQWIMQGLHGINPYTTPGTNEYGAYQYEISH